MKTCIPSNCNFQNLQGQLEIIHLIHTQKISGKPKFLKLFQGIKNVTFWKI